MLPLHPPPLPSPSRYCECFQAGVKCTDKCKCCDCLNPAGVNPVARSAPPDQPAKGGAPAQALSPGVALSELLVPLAGASPGFSSSRSPGVKKQKTLSVLSPSSYVDNNLLAAAAAAGAADDEKMRCSEKLEQPSPTGSSGQWGNDPELAAATRDAAPMGLRPSEPYSKLTIQPGRSGLGAPGAAATPSPMLDGRGVGPTPPAKHTPPRGADDGALLRGAAAATAGEPPSPPLLEPPPAFGQTAAIVV